MLFFKCRSLCLAGCNTEVRNNDGIKAEITALKYGFHDISDLLNKVRSVSFAVLSYVNKVTYSFLNSCVF